MRADHGATGLAEEREVIETVLALHHASRADEFSRANGAALAVVDAEAAAGVDELEREARAQASRRVEDRAGRREVRIDRRELRARMSRHPYEAHGGSGRVERSHGVRDARQRHPELRLVVTGRDVAVRVELLRVDTGVDANRDASDASLRGRASGDARDLFHALDVNRADADVPDTDGEIELVVTLRDAVIDEAVRRDATPHGEQQLRAAHDIRTAALVDERAHDRPGAVGLDGVRNEVRRALERVLELACLARDSIDVVDVGWGADASARVTADLGRLPRQLAEADATEHKLAARQARHGRTVRLPRRRSDTQARGPRPNRRARRRPRGHVIAAHSRSELVARATGLAKPGASLDAPGACPFVARSSSARWAPPVTPSTG